MALPTVLLKLYHKIKCFIGWHYSSIEELSGSQCVYCYKKVFEDNRLLYVIFTFVSIIIIVILVFTGMGIKSFVTG